MLFVVIADALAFQLIELFEKLKFLCVVVFDFVRPIWSVILRDMRIKRADGKIGEILEHVKCDNIVCVSFKTRYIGAVLSINR